MLFDGDKRLLLWNEAFVRLIMPEGTEPKVGMHLSDLAHVLYDGDAFVVPDGVDRAGFHEMIVGAVEGFAQDFPLERTDGLRIEGSCYPTPLGGYLGSARDVTQRVFAEEQAREADALVRTIVDASPTTFLVSRFDDGKVIYQPGLSRERFGSIETTLEFFLDPAHRTDYLEALSRTGSVTDYPVRFRRGDGSIMDGLTSARVIEFRGERLIVSSTRDVTDFLAMQAELERQRESAHQAEKMSAMGSLLAGVAHELNNPLSVVVGYAMMLSEKATDPVLARRLAEISAAAERCARIVRAFLGMARQRPAELAPVALNEIVDLAVEVAGTGIRAAGGAIDLALDPDLPEVMADADQIAQVFANLVNNAEHAMQDRAGEARLVISSRVSGPVVEVSFADNGTGIDDATRSRIFEPFFTTKDVGSGTGIGLAFAHRIVTGHGGRIEVASAPGKGASFSVRLPRRTASAPGIGPAEAPTPAPRSILVVDDNAGVAALLQELLAEAGHEVTTAQDGPSALQLCEDRAFDVVLCDVRMPGMDGTRVLAELRARGSASAGRFAFLTGDALSPGIAERIAAAGRPCLEKPVTPGALLAIVAELAGPPDGDHP